tara:strand:+ start:418 stop:624 length:207 start_codon:yes stop_codon:yes gene_type:complete
MKMYLLMARPLSIHSTDRDWFCLESYNDSKSAEKALEEQRAKLHMREYQYKIEEEDDLRELFGGDLYD